MPSPIGEFEMNARMRLVREGLWRSLWSMQHAYEGLAGDDWTEDRGFEAAMRHQDALFAEAEGLGFSGDRDWIKQYANGEIPHA